MKKRSFTVKSRQFLQLFSLFLLLIMTNSLKGFGFDTPFKHPKINGHGHRFSGGDFSLDFAAAKPSTYDHNDASSSFGNFGTGANTFVVESLEGGDFKCDEYVSYLTQIKVDKNASGTQTIALDYSFLADATGQSGVGHKEIVAVGVNTGDPGMTDNGTAATATLDNQNLTGLFNKGTLTGTVTITGLNASDVIIVHMKVRLACQQGATPTGNLQGAIVSGTVTDPSSSTINVGNQTIPFKQVGQIIYAGCALPPAGPYCAGSTNSHTATANVDAAMYTWDITGDGKILDGNQEVSQLVTNAGAGVLTSSVQVKAGTSGSYTLSVNISKNGTVSQSCSVTVSVDPASVGGSVGSPQTVCTGNQPANDLTLTGETGAVVRWEKSTTATFDMGTVTTIANTSTTLLASTLGALTQNTWFRAVVQSGTCSEANSAPVKISVDPASVGGAVTGGSSVCALSNSGNLTLSGNVGDVVRWESAPDNSGAPGTWTEVKDGSNNSITSTTLAFSNLSATTWFRAVVKSGSCSEANSDPDKVTVTPAVTPTFTAIGTLCQFTKAPSLPTASLEGIPGTWSPATISTATTGTTTYTFTPAAGQCANQATLDVTVNACSSGITFTQGFWGGTSGNGKDCGGRTVNTLLPSLLSSQPKVGTASQYLVLNDAAKLMSIMPGGSYTTTVLNGAYTLNPYTLPSAYIDAKSKKLNSVLISQTIALKLNILYTQMYTTNNLENISFEEGKSVLNTASITYSTDGNCTILSTAAAAAYPMSQKVICYLFANAGTYGGNIGGLMKLANAVVGGDLNIASGSPFSYSDLVQTLDAINKGFDKGAVLTGYTGSYTCPLMNMITQSAKPNLSSISPAVTQLTISAYPNPFTDHIRFTIQAPKAGRATLEVYNLLGQKVGVPFEGQLNANETRNVEYTAPPNYRSNLVYMLRMNGEQVSGKLMSTRQ